jgi:putative DNA primase/helicase
MNESLEGTSHNGTTWANMGKMITPVAWAWPDWLPYGLLTGIVGQSGTGKSALALRIAACFLRGDPWPDGAEFNGNTSAVLWCEAEAAQAINLQRARAWNLPLDKLLTPFDDPLTDVQLDNPGHQEAVATSAWRTEVKLIIVDSLRGAHRGDENSSETVKIVKWLAELARDTGKPVLLTHHLRKRGLLDNGNRVTLDQVRGTTAIVQIPRVIWAVDTPYPANEELKRLYAIKNNLAPFTEPIGLTIDDTGLVFSDAPEPLKRQSQEERAADRLKEWLADGPMRAADIEAEIEKAGLTMDAAKRAKRKLGIESSKPNGVWYWSPPETGTP